MTEFIWDSYATLNKCREIMDRKITGAYLRFGDGDYYLREGRDDSLQKGNANIAREMKEAFELTGEGIIKCLPLHSDKFGCMPLMKPGVHKWDDWYANAFLEGSIQYFQNEPIYSPVALHYVGVYDREYTVDFLRFIRQFKPIFVGNERVPAHIVHQLFTYKTHIKTPPDNCYEQLDRIERETLHIMDQYKDEYQVIVLAMGTSGRMLMNRILRKIKYRVFLFDFGSLLDAICDWNTRQWIELSHVPPNYFADMLHDISREP